jgi:hypothetical protein
MAQVLTPKDIVSHLLAADGKPSAFKPWNNDLQKWVFVLALACLSAGALIALGVKQKLLPLEARWWALGTLAVSQIAAVVYQLTIVIPAVKMFGDPAKTVAEPAIQHFDADVQAITDLANTYEQHHLDYACDRLTQVVEQMKFRVGFMIGAIEKVGIFPGAIAGYFYAKEILEKPSYASSGLEWVFAGLVAFYIMATVFMTASQRIERLALVAKHAAAKKTTNLRQRNGVIVS